MPSSTGRAFFLAWTLKQYRARIPALLALSEFASSLGARLHCLWEGAREAAFATHTG